MSDEFEEEYVLCWWCLVWIDLSMFMFNSHCYLAFRQWIVFEQYETQIGHYTEPDPTDSCNVSAVYSPYSSLCMYSF